MPNNTLRTLQLVELKILLEIKRVCECHDIKYFLIGGTLLGAVRHQGFIPWDDDIDIGMLRSDYIRFQEIFPHVAQPEYSLETYNTDAGWNAVFGKVRLKDTMYYEPVCENVLENNGIWIDIFPFDNLPSSNTIKRCQSIIFTILESILWIKYGYQKQKSQRLVGRIYQFGCKVLSIILPRQLILKTRELILQKYNKHPTEYIINWPFKSAKREWFDELTELTFETIQFPVPKKYHEYLTSFYGDYMQIPPENERPQHSPYEPNFGEYAYIKTLDDILPKKE